MLLYSSGFLSQPLGPPGSSPLPFLHETCCLGLSAEVDAAVSRGLSVLSWSQSSSPTSSLKDASSLPSYPLGSGWCVGFPSPGRVFVRQYWKSPGVSCGASTGLRWLSFWDFVPTDGWPGAHRGLDFVCLLKTCRKCSSNFW